MSYKVELVYESSSSALGPSGHPFGDGLRSMTHKQTCQATVLHQRTALSSEGLSVNGTPLVTRGEKRTQHLGRIFSLWGGQILGALLM
jgi:hypothetical protein